MSSRFLEYSTEQSDGEIWEQEKDDLGKVLTKKVIAKSHWKILIWKLWRSNTVHDLKAFFFVNLEAFISVLVLDRGHRGGINTASQECLPRRKRHAWQVGNIERGVWEGMDCVQARGV